MHGVVVNKSNPGQTVEWCLHKDLGSQLDFKQCPFILDGYFGKTKYQEELSIISTV